MSLKIDDDNNDGILAEINVTPLIDIMMVLLIIFMLTSSIALESGLDIDLPKTTSVTSSKEGSAVIVSLNEKGSVSVQGKPVDVLKLKDAIHSALSDSKTGLVIFEGDKKAYFGRAIEIMDIAKAAGAKKFAIATEEL